MWNTFICTGLENEGPGLPLPLAPGHVTGTLHLGFRTGGAAQFTPLELLQDLPLFGIQLVSHDNCLLLWSRVAFRLPSSHGPALAVQTGGQI